MAALQPSAIKSDTIKPITALNTSLELMAMALARLPSDVLRKLIPISRPASNP